MTKGRLSIILISSLVFGLLFSVAAMSQSSEFNAPKAKKQMEEGHKYWKDIAAGMKKIGKDMKAFKENDAKIEELLKKAEQYQKNSLKILSKASELQIKGMKLELSGADDLDSLHSFQSSLVNFAARYSEYAQVWYETLLQLKQNMETMSRLTLLLMDDAEMMLSQYLEKVPDKALEKAEKEMESGESDG